MSLAFYIVVLVFFLSFFFLTFSSFRSTKHDHVKVNLPAKLLHIRTFGKMKLEEFKDLLSVTDFKMCESKMDKNPTWYPLTLDVFVKFLYKVIFVFIFLEFSSPCLCLVFIIFLFVLEGNIQSGGYRGKVVP